MSANSLPIGPEYREVPDCPGYMAGSDGSLWSCWTKGRWPQRTGRWWRVQSSVITASGHLRVNLRTASGFRTSEFLHRLILTTFVSPCPIGMVACHDPDPNPANCSVDNLRWATPTANSDDCKRHGRFARGEKMPQAKFRDEDVPEVFRLRRAKWTHDAIAEKFGVRRALITRMLLRLRYAHVEVASKEPLPTRGAGRYAVGTKHPMAKVTEADVLEMRRLRSEGWIQKDIATKFSVKTATVQGILAGKYWRHV
jgi:hypothetical protein